MAAQSAMTQRSSTERLVEARVLVVGLGALGSPAALHLAAAGVGALFLVDPDRVEVSNLHRQVLHRTSSLSEPKVHSAVRRLRELYPKVRLEAHFGALSADNAAGLMTDVDFVIDGTDGVASKFLVNDAAVLCGCPFSHAGILGFCGQTMTVLPGQSCCYRCLFPEPPPTDAVPTCQEAGVMGPIAGLFGTIQAAEAIKYVSGAGDLLADRLLTYDGLSGRCRRIALSRNPRCPVCKDPRRGSPWIPEGKRDIGVDT